jgi:predicted ester cyclase
VTPTEHAAFASLDALNQRDLERLRDLVTDDFVDHGSPFPLPPGPDGYIAILRFVTETLQIRYEVKDSIAADDKVVIRAVAHGVASAAVHGPDAAGKPYTMNTIHIFRGEGDRLAEHWGVRDELGVLFQLGVMAPPDAALLPITAESA